MKTKINARHLKGFCNLGKLKQNRESIKDFRSLVSVIQILLKLSLYKFEDFWHIKQWKAQRRINLPRFYRVLWQLVHDAALALVSCLQQLERQRKETREREREMEYAITFLACYFEKVSSSLNWQPYLLLQNICCLICHEMEHMSLLGWIYHSSHINLTFSVTAHNLQTSV